MLRSYFRWIRFGRTGRPYRNTPLIGNPYEVRGHAKPPRRSELPFSRARFGKYERRKQRKQITLRIVWVLLGIGALWLIWESLKAFAIFT